MRSWISRVRVTGGFLEGLDLEFSPGLNVIVGARGSGKTSVLELLRHAVGLPEGSPASSRRSLVQHAMGAGEVVLDVRSDAGLERFVVDAEGNGRPPAPIDSGLMLGQNELESVADNPERRLQLLDIRAGLTVNDGGSALREIVRLTARCADLRSEVRALNQTLYAASSLIGERALLKARETELLAQSTTASNEHRQQLTVLENELLQTRRQRAAADAAADVSSNIAAKILEVDPFLRALQEIRPDGPLGPVFAQQKERLQYSLQTAADALESLTTAVQEERERTMRAEQQLRTEAEPLRTSLEQAERGLGSVTAQLRDIDLRLQTVRDAERTADRLRAELDEVVTRRGELFESLEVAGERVFDMRRSIAADITSVLQRRVQVVVEHLADARKFEELLSSGLRGSGLKYGALSQAIAESVLPRTLLEYIEQHDSGALAASAGILESRAERVIDVLDDSVFLQKLAQMHLEDAVYFQLQDGVQLKNASDLSMGQKCAVALPIVLTDDSRFVILDQPEDHLDNQFLVDRVITSIVARTAAGAQTIVATHNPNIPVLGDAATVVVMVSDGAHGDVGPVGPYDSQPVVEVITSLMEGGSDAFRRRANFYAQHPVKASQ